MNATRFYSTVLTAFLCGAMIAPAFAGEPVTTTLPSAPVAAPAVSPDSTSAASTDPTPVFTTDPTPVFTTDPTPVFTTDPTPVFTTGDSTDGITPSIPAVSDMPNPRYSFVYGQVGSEVFVSLRDAQDEDDAPILFDVLSTSGKLSRMGRAKVIADRLQKLYDETSDKAAFVSHLQSGHVDTQVVVAEATGAGNSMIVTADPRSRRVAHAPSCDAYAQLIINDIDKGLKGIKFRDAAFDYTLTADQKNERGYEYYKEGMEAYRDSAKPSEASDDKKCDILVAESKLATAVALLPDYQFCRLQLANIYAEQGDKIKAHELYAQVIKNDPDDKQDATTRDHHLGLSAS